MPGSCSVTYGIPGEKLEAFVADFIHGSKTDPFSTWLILPTDRLVRKIRGELDRQNIPYIVSRICTLEDFCETFFFDNRSTTQYITEAESKMLLSSLLVEHKEKFPLFIAYTRPSPATLNNLLDFIDTVTMRKVDFPACLRDLQSEKSAQIYGIIWEYRSKLESLDLVDKDARISWTIDRLSMLAPGQLGNISVYGLYRPLPLMEDLLAVMRAKSRSFHCFVPTGMDKSVFDYPLQWAGQIDEKNLPSQPGSPQNLLTGLFSAGGQIDTGGTVHLDTFPTPYAEFQSVAREICRLHASGVPLTDISVAIPDIHHGTNLLKEVFSDFGLPWNETASQTLQQSPVIRFLIDIIGLVARRYTREDLVRIVSSPYFRESPRVRELRLDPEEIDLVSRAAKIEQDRTSWLLNLDRLSVFLSEDPDRRVSGINRRMVDRVRSGVGDLFNGLQNLEGTRSAGDFIEEYRKFLKSFGLPHFHHSSGEEPRSLDENDKKEFCKHLDALSNSSWLPDKKIRAEDFLAILSTIAEHEKRGNEKDCDGVFVSGIRTCVHQHFPYLFICGLNEGAVPSLTTRLPFTNSLENVRMGTRSLSEILHEEEYYFIAALLSAENVFLSAPLADGEKLLLTSAFFERVKERSSPERWNTSDGDGKIQSRIISATKAGTTIDEGTTCQALRFLDGSFFLDGILNRINMERFYRHGLPDSSYDGILTGDAAIRALLSEQFGPEHVYSPTSLETYAECPFRFFLKDIAYLRELTEVEPSLSAADRGSMVHGILTTFYRRWHAAGKGKVGPATIPEALDLMQAVIDEERHRHPFESPLWEATGIQMKGCSHTGPGYFERFLQKEAEEETSPLVPTCFEFSFGMKRGSSDDPESVGDAVILQGLEGSEPLRIRGRIDRIDVCPDGFFLIYDYKTGSRHPKLKDIEAGKALQLPLYLHAFEQLSGKRGVAAGYYQVRKEINRNLTLCDETSGNFIISRPKKFQDLPGLLLRSHDFALEYIRRIRNGEFPLPSDEECPNIYCEFRRICRFNPYRVFETGEVS